MSDRHTATAERRKANRSNGFGPMGLGSLASGAAGYAVIALGTRAVGEVLFAPVSVLWSLWALSAAAISFPVQHWTIRSAEADGESAVWPQLPRLLALVAGLSIATALLCLVLGSRLFPAAPVAFSLMASLLPVGAFAVGLQRGVLTHRRRFRTVAALIAGENTIRAVVALGVLTLGGATVTSTTVLGWGILSGFLIAAVTPSALRPGTDTLAAASRSRPASVRLLGGFASANVSAQAALTSAPIVLALFSAPEPVITEVFAILALLRVPYTGLVGASAAVTGPLSRLVDGGQADAVRRWEVRSAIAVVFLAATAFLVAPAVLPPTVALLFSTEVTVSATTQGLLAAGGVVAVAGLAEMLVLLALQRPRRLIGGWLVGLGAGSISLLVPLHPPLRVGLAFFVAEAVAVAGLVIRHGSHATGEPSDATSHHDPDRPGKDLDVQDR